MSRLEILIEGINFSQVLVYIKLITAKYRGTTILSDSLKYKGQSIHVIKEEIIECLDSINS